MPNTSQTSISGECECSPDRSFGGANGLSAATGGTSGIEFAFN